MKFPAQGQRDIEETESAAYVNTFLTLVFKCCDNELKQNDRTGLGKGL